MGRPYELRPAARRRARDHARRLVDAVACATGVPVADIVRRSPDPALFRLRAACAWLIRRVDNLSYREVGLALGWPDHSTGRHLVKRGEQLRSTDWPIRLLTDRILGEIA